MDARPHSSPIARREWLDAAVVTAVALVVRAIYTAIQGLPPYDPWRHLLLVDRLREGAGFSLFEGQPYLWYQPVWHPLAALLPDGIHPGWLAALLSALCCGLFRLWLGDGRLGLPVPLARAAALALALYGPFVAYTCHYGPEAWSLFLLLAALTASWRASARRAVALCALAGLLFGIALLARMNLAFLCLLFLPALGRFPARWAAAGLGGLLPLALGWWRNRAIIAEHPFVFSWDGLATPSDGFDALSTLIVQRHPDVAEGLRRLHEVIIPRPEWLVEGGALQLDRMLFLALGCLAVLLSRRWWLLAPVGLTLAYYLLLDATLSSNFYRLYVGLFPWLIAGMALTLARMAPRRDLRPAAGALLIGIFLIGTPDARPRTMPPAEALSAPAEGFLVVDGSWRAGDAPLLVASGFYHPEVLLARFPGRRIVGMPLRHEEWERFRKTLPNAELVLWHEFHPQQPLYEALARQDCVAIDARANTAGRRFVLSRCKR